MSHKHEEKIAFSLFSETDPAESLPGKIFLFWFIGAFFYLYQVILKVLPSVTAEDLAIDLNVGATSLGALGGMYFLAYASMQLPIGILLDRFGVRRLMTIAVLMCSIGALLFSMADTIFSALVARFIIGMGASGAFIGTIKLITMWFPERLVPIFTGLTVFIGAMGGVLGNKSAMLLEWFTWRELLKMLSVMGLLLSMICFFFLRNKVESGTNVKSFKDLKAGLKQVVSSPQLILIALFAFFIYLPLSVLADMWGNLFIQRTYGFSRQSASECIQMIYYGTAIGAPLFGLIASLYTNYRIIFRIITVAQLPIMAAIIWLHLPTLFLLKTFFFFLGVLLGGQALKFNAAFAHASPKVSASIVGFVNMLCMFGGFVFQQIVGMLLDFNWDGALENGHKFYSAETFGKALSIHIFALAICFFCTYYIRNKKQEEDEEL